MRRKKKLIRIKIKIKAIHFVFINVLSIKFATKNLHNEYSQYASRKQKSW